MNSITHSPNASVSVSNGYFFSSKQDNLIVMVPQNRKTVSHLPEALKNHSSIHLPDGRELEVKINKGTYTDDAGINSTSNYLAGVHWEYIKTYQTLDMTRAFLCDLPHWVKIGPESAWIDKDKGIPTIQACKAILVNTLNLKGRVKQIALYSMNNQTKLDVNLNLLKGASLEEACVNSQSAYLAAELGEMLGGKVRLVSIEIEEKISVTSKTYMDVFGISKPSNATERAFLQQKKLGELASLLKPEQEYSFIDRIGMEFEFIPDEPL